MQRKFPSRKHRVGPLSEYLGTGTPIVTKITGGQIARAIRNLTPGTAPGPDGFHAEHLRMTLKAQSLEIGKDVTNEIARYATAFGAGLLPVHTYYFFFEEAALMMKLPKRHATPGRGPACTNHNCHLARLGVTVVSVKPPQAAYSVHASL